MLLKRIFFLWMTGVIVLALGLPMVAQPTTWYQFPTIPALEEKARIIFFHVPTAWLSALAFVMSMIYGIQYLRKKRLEDDIKSSAAAGLGFLFCFLATTTGEIWAKFS